MKFIVVFACLSVITTAVFSGEIKVYYDDPSTKAILYVETDLLKVGIAASKGMVTEWYVKSLEKNIALAGHPFFGVLAQRFASFDIGLVYLDGVFSEGWPTPIGLGDYQTEVVSINARNAVVRQTYTVPEGSMFSGLRVEKTYSFQAKKYHIDVSYVITNTSNEVKSLIYDGVEYGINLTVETTVRCGVSSSHLAYKSEGKVYSSLLPSLPLGPVVPNYLTSLPIQWCAVADVEGGYVVGSKYAPEQTHGLWPGEPRPWQTTQGYDYETIFRSVVYQPGQSERYQFIVYGGPGSIETFSRINLGKEVALDFGKPVDIPSACALLQNYPNPFNPTTTIRYGLPERSLITLSVFNTLGQKVTTLVEGEQGAGYHEVKFDASSLPSGVYYYRLQAGSYVRTKALLLLR